MTTVNLKHLLPQKKKKNNKTGSWKQWWSRRNLSTYPFTSTPNSQLIAEQPSFKKTQPTKKGSLHPKR